MQYPGMVLNSAYKITLFPLKVFLKCGRKKGREGRMPYRPDLLFKNN
jgi:hypothetical protein